MPKVFHTTLIGVELIGPKVRPIGVADGQQVKIPVLNYFKIMPPHGGKDFKGGQNGKSLARQWRV